MKRYYNSKTNSWYIEGNSITINTNKGLFSGIPTEEQLAEWGYKEHIEPIPEPISEEQQASIDRQNRMQKIKEELALTDYRALKAIEGCDMSKYGDWQGERQALRDEYNELEEEQKEYYKSLEELDSIENN